MFGGANTASWAVVVVGYGDTRTGRGVFKWLAGQWGLFWLVLGVGWVNETQGSSMAHTGVFGL